MLRPFASRSDRRFVLSLALLAGMLGAAAGLAQAENRQSVTVEGSTINLARSGGTAVMNLASTKRSGGVAGSSSQQVEVRGAVLNTATAGAYTELNVGSRTDQGVSGSQTVSVRGPIVNTASGRGVRSVVNIGGR